MNSIKKEKKRRDEKALQTVLSLLNHTKFDEMTQEEQWELAIKMMKDLKTVQNNQKQERKHGRGG